MPDVDQAVPTEVHEAECHCDSFSDCYKDVTGRRPRDEIARWTCARVTQWFHENYIETSPRHFEPRVPFEGAPVSPRTLPVTPAERCLAAMLRAWLDYSPSDECNVDQQNALADIGNRLRRLGVTNTLKATPAGAALLARVEAAPGYEQGRRDAIADAADHLSACHDPTITPRNAARMIVDHEAARLAGATPLDAPPAKEPR